MAPIISIFIPTYNRADHLKEALESIVAQPEFLETDKIEIVISDNASTDNTQEICEDFVNRFPAKIIYNRNSENLGCTNNMLKLKELANGECVKFLNDTVNLKENALKEMLNFVNENIQEKPVLIFLNKGKNQEFSINSPDDLLKKMSYNLTWIGTICFWREDFSDVEKSFKVNIDNLIEHVSAIYDLLYKKRKGKILAKSLFEVHHIRNKGGYNIAEVFGQNYIKVLNEYKHRGAISCLSVELEKILLLKHINFLYFDIKGKHNYEKHSYFKYMMTHYWYNPYFYLFYAYVQILKLLKK